MEIGRTIIALGLKVDSTDVFSKSIVSKEGVIVL
jgi:hypothetical protein